MPSYIVQVWKTRESHAQGNNCDHVFKCVTATDYVIAGARSLRRRKDLNAGVAEVFKNTKEAPLLGIVTFDRRIGL